MTSIYFHDTNWRSDNFSSDSFLYQAWLQLNSNSDSTSCNTEMHYVIIDFFFQFTKTFCSDSGDNTYLSLTFPGQQYFQQRTAFELRSNRLIVTFALIPKIVRRADYESHDNRKLLQIIGTLNVPQYIARYWWPFQMTSSGQQKVSRKIIS